MIVNENVDIMGKDVIISYDNQIPGDRELTISELVLQSARAMMPCCGAQVAGIKALTATCPGTKYPGQTLTLRATGTGGTPPYRIVFVYGAVEIGVFTAVPENTEKSVAYTITEADVGNKSANVTILDSCPGGMKSCTETCNVLVVACPVPTCSFTVT